MLLPQGLPTRLSSGYLRKEATGAQQSISLNVKLVAQSLSLRENDPNSSLNKTKRPLAFAKDLLFLTI